MNKYPTLHRHRVGPMPARRRAMLILAGLLFIAAMHWIVPTSPHAFHALHIVLRKLFIVPIILAAAWFGLRGAMVAAGISSLLYGPHILVSWTGQFAENLNQLADMALFWVVAAIAGLLYERERAATLKAEQAHHGTLEALASALDAREHETDRHSERVADLALRIAERFGLNDSQLRVLRDAARLHDVGKIGVRDQLLLKPGKLDDAERQQMQQHAEIGSRIVHRLPSLHEAAELIRCHHERYDGTGYPRGLRGESIPLAARIFTVADVYDALTNDRPYRKAMPYPQAMRMIHEGSGSAFDPSVVAAFEAEMQARSHDAPAQREEAGV